MVITIRSKFLIALAWGPRRVTSSTRYGTTKAYPSYVTASHSLWFSWLKSGAIKWLKSTETIVVPDSRATARIQAALEGSQKKEPTYTLDQDTIDALLKKREELRLQRKFVEADEIRDKLLKAGVSVSDQKIQVSQNSPSPPR